MHHVLTLFFAEHNFLLFGPPVFSRALGCVARRGAVCTHHGANAGPGRGPWRVLWVFKVANSDT